LHHRGMAGNCTRCDVTARIIADMKPGEEHSDPECRGQKRFLVHFFQLPIGRKLEPLIYVCPTRLRAGRDEFSQERASYLIWCSSVGESQLRTESVVTFAFDPERVELSFEGIQPAVLSSLAAGGSRFPAFINMMPMTSIAVPILGIRCPIRGYCGRGTAR
jgi:hypothetical protein